MNSFRRLSGSGLLRAFVERRSTPRYAKAAPVPPVQCVFERLEPRILLSADVLGGIAANDLLQGDQHADLTAFDTNQNLEQLIAPFLVSSDKQSHAATTMPIAIDLADLSSLLDSSTNDNTTSSNVDVFAESLKSLLPELGSNESLRQEIIFVDAAAPDYEQLIDGIATDAAATQYLVFVLDSQRDGIAQIGEVLGNYTGIDAVHLVSHGEDGAIQLGNSVLDSQGISTNGDALTIWGQALSDGADLMIYGCNLAASDAGQAMLDSLALVTGADVAASDDLTGSAELGGDWTLEYNSGEIEAQIAFSQAMQQQWQATLAGEEYIDQFDTIAYNNSDGSNLWSTPWQEGGEIDGANAGRVYIDPQTYIASDNALFIGLDRSIEREIDLSGVLNATLTFDWAHVETTVGDSVVLEIYDGSTWNTLETFVGPVAGELTDTAYNSSSHDISAFIDANTRIRFTAALQVGYSEFTIDNVAIDTSNHIEMVWVDQAAGKIQAAELDGSNAFDLITGLASPLSVAVDTQGGKVYWSDDVLNTIQRANFDGSGMETIVSSVPGTVAIDLDTVNGKIYWVEGSGGQLSRANLDGTAPESLTGSPDIPSGIAIDVANDKIYWADPGNDRIKQTTLDGIGTSNLVSSGVGNSADIALNTSTGQLYWSDDVTGTINRVDSDGTNITTVISGLGSPYGLAVDGAAGKIYWTDTTTGQLHAANLDGSDNQVIATGLTGARDVDVVVGAAVVVAANSAPIAVDDANYTTNAGQALVVDASNDLLENDSDVDADTLNTWVVNGPANGILNIDPTGLVNATVIASSTFNEDNPAWSPDGSKLAFTSDRSGFQELWVVNSDGTGLTQVTTHGAVGVVVGGPAWSPDGSQLYFHSNLSGGDNDIYVIDAATTGVGTQLSTNSTDQIQPSVSPDGSIYAFASNGTGDYELYVEPAGGGAATQLTFNGDNDRHPVWSPDGSTLLFTSNRLGNFGIYEYDIATTTQTLITNTAGNDRSPEYSPDGSKIIFHSNVDGDNEIFVYNKATTLTTQLTNNSPAADTNATWSPDGTKIVYVSDIGGDTELVVADLLFDGTFDYIPNNGYSGVDTFTYKATDGSADSNLATATITVNTAPTADAGGPYTINEGDSLVLDASASSDPETTPTYTWDIDGDGQYDDASGVNPTVTWASLGTMSLPINDDGPYTVEVRVDDGAGGVTTDSVTLTVNNVAPTLSTTGTGSADYGTAYTLNLSASDPGDDTISSWTINWGDGAIDTYVGNPGSVTHTYANGGFTYNILASAIDEDGTHLQNQLLVANSGDNSLSRFGPDAGFLQQFATGDNDYPVDVIVGPDGNLYVSGWDSDDVLRYNATSGAFIDTFIATGEGGLSSAAGLAFGPDGNLYVASRLSGEVLRFDATNGDPLGAFVATATSGGLTEPEGLTFGPDGDLYVSDYDSGEVYKYGGTTGVFDSVFVSTADNGGLVTPEDLTFGPDGNLYVASDDGSTVLRYNGSTGASMGEFIASGSGLTNATGITFGPDGNLYVSSWGTDSVMRFNGTSGALIGTYISAASGALDKPDYLNFVPEHQVTVDGNKEPTGAVVISGSPVEDSVLSASQTIADGDGMGAVSYQWQRDGDDIAGATGNSYLLDDVDVGSVISVKAAYMDGKGNAEKVISSDTAIIAGVNDAPTLSAPGTVFINEIHYDNIGPDFGEFIEIAGVAGTNLNGWSLVLYNGGTNSVYHTEMLSGIIPNETSGFGAISWTPGGANAIQNAISAPDGIALVDNRGNVVQFISYEGAFVADGGPADGMLSTNIGVAENNLTTPGFTSLQLKGAGTTFTWSPSSLDSPGSLNAGQDINALATATHQSVAEDDTLVFSSANGNAIDIEDVDADQGAAEPILVQLNVINGTVVPGSTAGLGSISGVGTSALAMTGTVSEINAALEGLTFTPDANYHGAAVISIFVNDQGNNGAGGALQTGGVIFIDVASMPDDPTIENSIANQNATENALFNFTFAADTFADADGETLTYSATLASGGLLPGWLNFDPASRTFSGTPLNGNIGFVDVEVTADDSQTGSTPATDVFRITVASDNNDPTLDNAISDQIGFAHDPYSFTFAADTFSDLDGDSLSYSARLANGNPLPGWLSFDAATRTFSSAEPGHVAIGSIDVEVIADDGEGGTPATAVFGITIDHRNDDPVVINPIVDQLATEDEAFSFVVPADTFEDYEGQAMTYSAELDNGDPLPTWLSFDAATRTFSGTPLGSDVGQIDIKVYADDGAGGSENDTFELAIVASNDDPVVNNPIPDQLALEDTLFNFTFAPDAFSDEEGDTLTYNATLAGGGALPGWLIFDPSTRTFSGTPLNGDVGAIDVDVSADDGQAGSVAANDTFRITVANDNDDPTLDNAIADQSATEDAAFSFTFNANTFGDVDSGDTLVYSATLPGGAALPAWLDFDASTRTFSGTPLQADVGTLNVTVTADDTRGGSPATDTFAIVIANSNDAPVGSVVLSPTAPTNGQTISAAISVSDEDGMGALSYQWQRAGVDIAGATSSTYVVTNADVGAPLTLVVSYIDSFGQAEAVVSNNAAIFIPPVVEPTPPTSEPGPEPEPEVTESNTPTDSEEGGDPVPETQEPPVEPGAEENSDDTVSVFEADNAEAAQINAAIDESAERDVEEDLDYKEKDFDIAQVSFNLVRLQSEYTPYNDPLTLVQFGGFVDAIDQMREDIIDAALDNAPVVGSTFAVSAGMSAGYVAWLARSGAVLGSVMSAMPMWRFIDPLPVLNKLDDGSEDEESLEAIIDNSEKNSAAANVAAEAAVDVDVDSNNAASDKIEKPGAAPDSTH